MDVSQEDIKNRWTTYEKMLLRFNTRKHDLIELGIAQDKAVYDDDGTVIEEFFIPDDRKARTVNFDETYHPFSDEGRQRWTHALGCIQTLAYQYPAVVQRAVIGAQRAYTALPHRARRSHHRKFLISGAQNR